LRSIRQGGETVLIPANPTDAQGLVQAFADPRGLVQFESQGNANHGEPVYATVDEFLKGQNSDGSNHAGYIVVDIVAKVVVDLCDRDGRSVVDGLVLPFNSSSFLQLLQGRGVESFCL